MASRKKIFPVLLPAVLFIISLYLIIQLYKDNDTGNENSQNQVLKGCTADRN